MPITVCCKSRTCREVFDVRDAFAGLMVKCPACGVATAVAVRVDEAPIAAPRRDAPDPRRQPVVSPQAQWDTDVPPPLPAPVRSRARSRRFRGRSGARRGARKVRHTGPKERHGCVTAWLTLVILANSAGMALCFYLQDVIARAQPDLPAGIVLAPMAIFVANIVCAVALFNWQKWGFYGLCFTSAAGVAFSVATEPKPGPLGGAILSVVILYAVLQMGGKRSTWSQME